MFELVKLPRGNFDYLIEIVELEALGASSLLTREEVRDLGNFIALHPECGEVIPRTGGLRKIRWRRKGGRPLRVVYLFHDLNMPVYLLGALAPGQVLRLRKWEEIAMAQLVDTIIRERVLGRMTGHTLSSSA